MKSLKTTCWFSIICILLFFGCDTTIPLPNQEENQVLVANSFFSPDSIWKVQLTQSAHLTQVGELPVIINGQVEVIDLENGRSLFLTSQGDGMYTNKDNFPIANKKYQLKVKTEGFPEIQANNQVPDSFSVALLSHQPFAYRNQPSYQFELAIKDNPLEANFYLITVQYLIEKAGKTQQQQAGHFTFDTNSENELVLVDHVALRQSYLPDKNFNGQTYTTVIGANSPSLKEITPMEKLTAFISVKSITKAGYQHAKTVESFEQNEDSFTAEAVAIFSNIEQGLGIFAGYTEQLIKVQLQ